MKNVQRLIKYGAIIFALILVINIFTLLLRVVLSFVDYNKDDKYTSFETFNVTDNIEVLDLEIKSSNLNIKTGDNFYVDSDDKDIRINTSNNKLSIKEINNKIINNTKSNITIYIPENYIFNSSSIEAGAGIINIEKLRTNELDFDLGAGKTTLYNLEIIKEADIDTGAGELIINNSKFNNLDLDLGVGKVEVNAYILGKSTIDAGVGELNVKLLGNKTDYSIRASKGIGSFTLDGEKVIDNNTYGNGYNTINITGGVGSIKIEYDNIEKIYTKTYKVLNKINYQEEYKYYVTLQEFQGNVETVIIEDKANILQEDMTYEFEFDGVSSNNIKDNFNNKLLDMRLINGIIN